MSRVGVSKKEDFYTSLGFEEDPFKYTNADQESRLDHYFVDPPYYQSLWGKPEEPETHVVLAPRGGGKSAQRRMIEDRGISENVFVVTYDYFFTTNIKSLDEVDLGYHLRNLNKLTLITYFGHLSQLDVDPNFFFPSDERKFLTKMIDNYLGEVDTPTIKDVVKRSMTIPTRVKKWWNENLPLVGLASVFLKAKFGLSGVAPGKFEEPKLNEDPMNQFNILVSIIKKSFKAFYVLIDKVDETELTGNDPEKSYRLISPLIKDLRFVNSNEIAIKFFLWDALEPFYEVDARRDRVQDFRLEWRYSELCTMIDRRLIAYSDGKVSSLKSLFDESIVDPYRTIISFSNNSPRNIIRMLQDIVDEQIRRGIEGKIDSTSLDLGIKKFCRESARPIYGIDLISDLKRISMVGFTTNYLSSDLF
ncbi:P-loop ATPase, Sll1717 family [Paenibacillus thermotolerans]|uniref:P-loop ATPase, Sll1717 family n=1 Tax=Paenibacillus thermotolerans TaxID=3027807 RepID=UPI002367639C|nr:MULTISPECIES: hypothetical protein [unclassified Paenibacillus]